MWYAHEGMGWWMLFGGLFWLSFVVLIAWTAFQLLHRDLSDRADSIEQVKARYARGEIDRDEFQRIVQDLTQTAPASRSPAKGDRR